MTQVPAVHGIRPDGTGSVQQVSGPMGGWVIGGEMEGTGKGDAER